MSSAYSQQWTRRIRYTDQHIRVSDAERSAVTERLAAHYGDGRLDQAEFDERVNRAMGAKTRGDLDGLFDDLPDPEPAGAPGVSGMGQPTGPAVLCRRRRASARTFLLIGLGIALMIAVGHTFAAIYVPWVWVGLLATLILLVSRSTRTRNDR